MDFNPMDYLTDDEKHELAVRMVSDQMGRHIEGMSFKTLLSNVAYEIVMERVKREANGDIEREITDNVEEILSKPEKIEFCLFYDGEKYGSFDTQKGIALKIAEDYVKNSCVDKINNLVDNVLKTIRLDTKKFEKMVMQEAARLVAEKAMKR